jgi:3-deoxy-D-manno-octulosonic acid kinase
VKARTHKQDSLTIVYDADRIQQPGAHLFDPQHWKRQGRLVGEAQGRGSALFLETDFAPAVLRRYLRGGWAARFSRDRYLFTGFERSRPLAEFRILKILLAAGLPVPEPLAAMCRRQGLFYTGWLLTCRIANADPLAALISDRAGDPSLWRETGRCIRKFHDFGLVHADLNARNILVDQNNRIYLIDLDRSRIVKNSTSGFGASLKRLKRSLVKLWPATVGVELEICWDQLQAGYRNP